MGKQTVIWLFGCTPVWIVASDRGEQSEKR